MNKSYNQLLKDTWNLATPIMVGNLGNTGVGLADTIMIGNLGTKELAAVSLGNSVSILSLLFCIGISVGITPVIANNREKINNKTILIRGYVINLSIGILVCIVTILSGYILYLLQQPEEVVALTIPYLWIIGVSFIPIIFFQTGKQYAEGLMQTKKAMQIIITCNVINIASNYILIFGKFGFPELGLEGAGYATLFSRIIMGIWMTQYIIKADWNKSIINETFTWSKNLVKRIIKIGLPTGFQLIFEVGAFSFVYIMTGWLSINALAAHQIAINLAGISYMVITGFAAASTVMVSKAINSNNYNLIAKTSLVSFISSIFIMLVFALIFIFFNSSLPSLYIENKEVIVLASTLLIIASTFQLSDGVQVVALGILRGMEDVKIPTLISLISYWGIAIPVGYYLGFKLEFGIFGIWYGLLIED